MFQPERLTAIRKALKYSQEEMARVLGVSFVSVNRWENGHSSPTGTVLEVYRALDLALRSGKTREQIVGEPTDPGRQLHRIFRAAYGGR